MENELRPGLDHSRMLRAEMEHFDLLLSKHIISILNCNQTFTYIYTNTCCNHTGLLKDAMYTGHGGAELLVWKTFTRYYNYRHWSSFDAWTHSSPITRLAYTYTSGGNHCRVNEICCAVYFGIFGYQTQPETLWMLKPLSLQRPDVQTLAVAWYAVVPMPWQIPTCCNLSRSLLV